MVCDKICEFALLSGHSRLRDKRATLRNSLYSRKKTANVRVLEIDSEDEHTCTCAFESYDESDEELNLLDEVELVF
jgi:uncharacterized protein YlxP (DUF503 family)